MTVILGIDPGSTHTGWARLRNDTVEAAGKDPNEAVLQLVAMSDGCAVVIEQIEPRFGIQAGWETLDTARWVGRYQQAARHAVLLRRSEVLRHFGVVTAPRAGEKRVTADAGLRAALIDRYGLAGGRTAAIGRKAEPGPLYGVVADAWSAVAVGLTHLDRLEETR